jgi:hypothetical protein
MGLFNELRSLQDLRFNLKSIILVQFVPYMRLVIGITCDTAKKTIDIFSSPEGDKRSLVQSSTVMGSLHELREQISSAILITSPACCVT